jgi:glycosyltransferase involved in cell wall biosynthesis
MLKFAEILSNGNNSDYNLTKISPEAVISRFIKKVNLIKWGAYIDKYLIFPQKLKSYITKRGKIDLVHILDHSNSPYLKTISNFSQAKGLITCHDLIAVRMGLKEFTSATPISSSGKMLQSWIQHSLPFADYFACDSKQTKKDLNRIIPSSITKSRVVHLGTESKFKHSLIKSNQKSKLSFDLSTSRFIVHVGSSAWYKNRCAVFQAFKYAKEQKQGKELKLVLVGPPAQVDEIDPCDRNWIENNSNEIISITNASEQVLQELYLNAELLIFPSYIEGFGWPPLEAASIGCRVVTTKTGAIHDLLGQNAYYVDPSDQQSVNAVVSEVLNSKKTFKTRVSLPSYNQCREEYYSLYHQIIKN